jgi:tol-pal system protein YbgF
MRMKKNLAAVALILLLAPKPVFSGTKEEVLRLQSDVLQLQNLVRSLHKSFDDNHGSNQSLLEQLNDQVATTNRLLQDMVTAMRSQQEEAVAMASALRDEMQNITIKLDDTNNRIAALHRKVEEGQTREQTLPLPTPIAGTDPKPDQIYYLAYNDYLVGNYELAITGFRDFLRGYAESEYADNAAYYLAICHQLQGRYEQAIQVFDEVINMYPKSDMAPSAYYKKATTQMELQKNDEAIETLSRLVDLYPDSQESELAKRELDTLGVGVSH